MNLSPHKFSQLLDLEQATSASREMAETIRQINHHLNSCRNLFPYLKAQFTSLFHSPEAPDLSNLTDFERRIWSRLLLLRQTAENSRFMEPALAELECAATWAVLAGDLLDLFLEPENKAT